MKKIVSLIVITMISVFSTLKAEAAILTSAEIKSAISQQAYENYKKYTDADIKVEVVALPFKDLSVPNGHVTYVVKPSMNKFVARDLEKVSVYVNGNLVESFNAPVVIKAWENVVVASNFINIGQPINTNNASVKRMEISHILEYPLRAESISKEIMAKKAFREGEIIDKRFVKLRPDVLRNANVVVLFCKDDLTVSIEATALSDGVIGESICLMNKNYNKIYTGQVIGENKVLVKI